MAEEYDLSRMREYVKKTAGYLNEAAGWAVAAAMVIVVLNVIARDIFKKPILGAYEYASFLTSVAISLGIVYCAVKNGHIVVDIFVDKLKERTQKIIGIITDSVVLFFLVLCTVRIFIHAGNLVKSGEVSATTRTPFYIFVYIMAVGFGMLCLVTVAKIIDAFSGRGGGNES